MAFLDTLSLKEILFFMASSLFLLGFSTFGTGVFVLVARAMGRDLRAIAAQTAHLAQKGLAEDVAGLVGNTSNLLNALSEMVRTAAGIGLFLTLVGLSLMGVAYWLLLQINWPAAF